jgi:hypothetical protein
MIAEQEVTIYSTARTIIDSINAIIQLVELKLL